MQDAFIIDALRTPVGKYGGTLSTVRPDDLAALVIKKILERNKAISGDEIEDVVFGAANQAGEDNRNVARMAVLLAGLPVSVAGVTVNRLCASGLQAIMDAAKSIRCGMGEVFLAGGVESMSRAPFVMSKSESAFSRKAEIFDTTIGWRFLNKKLAEYYYPYSMGETAENVAEKWSITREEQDEFAYESNVKYEQAHQSKKFDDELIPVEVFDEKGTKLFSKDEQPRLSAPDILAKLKPAFKKNGTVTAGNSSGINDGAACLILVSEKIIKEKNVKPLAKIRSMAVAGVDPAFMGIGPVPAVQKALQRAGLKSHELDLIELNEAFASQSIACIRELDLDISKVNVNGGAIAIGHPLGCSGARITATLLHEMKKRNVRLGLATMCIGVGQGAAVIYESM